jgi:hypothetical protein
MRNSTPLDGSSCRPATSGWRSWRCTAPRRQGCSPIGPGARCLQLDAADPVTWRRSSPASWSAWTPSTSGSSRGWERSGSTPPAPTPWPRSAPSSPPRRPPASSPPGCSRSTGPLDGPSGGCSPTAAASTDQACAVYGIRHTRSLVQESLLDRPRRRSGKIVLCQSLPEVEYFDCELPSVRLRLRDPSGRYPAWCPRSCDVADEPSHCRTSFRVIRHSSIEMSAGAGWIACLRPALVFGSRATTSHLKCW